MSNNRIITAGVALGMLVYVGADSLLSGVARAGSPPPAYSDIYTIPSVDSDYYLWNVQPARPAIHNPVLGFSCLRVDFDTGPNYCTLSIRAD